MTADTTATRTIRSRRFTVVEGWLGHPARTIGVGPGPPGLGREQPGRGQEPGVADHAVVGPDRLALDVPAPLEDLDRLGQPEGPGRERLPQLRNLPDGRQVGDEDASRAQGILGVLHDPPWLGNVEDHAVEAAGADALVGSAGLGAAPPGRLGPGEAPP